MSVTHYCDGCGKAMTEETDLGQALEFEIEPSPLDKHNSGRWPKHTITVQTIHAVEGTWNGGDVCRDCLVRVITRAHERRDGTVRVRH